MQRIRVGLYSHDRALQPLLASALSREFEFLLISDEDGMNRLIAADDCSVMMVDLNSNHESLQRAIECVRSMIAQQFACVIMADDRLQLTITELIEQGAYGYCRRPPSVRDLRVILRRAYESSALRQQVHAIPQPPQSTYDCDLMIGRGPQMQHIYQQVRSVANIDASVLVTGESGTGKELVARAIHNLGSRANRPFVAVACGAIPESLIEAELFGHEKGAFTGSVAAREGYFEQASDGTLFLDEIGDLSLYTQVKLLRVLQQREFMRLGSSKVIPVQARLVFATHQDLAELVAQGKFRQDLYYRIHVMGITVPTLQERSEDIHQIAEHFLRHYSTIFHKDIRRIEPKALALLHSYSWPGNIRELENVMQRAIIVSQTNALRVDDLPLHIQEELVVKIDEGLSPGSFGHQLHEYKVKLAIAAVRDHNGNKTMAARSLRISRAYLHRLIRLGVSGSLALVEEYEYSQSEPECEPFGRRAAL